MNNDENVEKERREHDEDLTTHKSLHTNQDILKRCGNVKWGQTDEKENKRGPKDKKMMKWWTMMHDLI